MVHPLTRNFSDIESCQSIYAMLCLAGASSAFSPIHQPRIAQNIRRSTTVAELTEVSYAADAPYREAQYDPEAADAFFRKRPLAVLRRAVQLASLSGGFLTSLFLDKLLKREDQKVDQRSKELLVMLARRLDGLPRWQHHRHIASRAAYRQVTFNASRASTGHWPATRRAAARRS